MDYGYRIIFLLSFIFGFNYVSAQTSNNVVFSAHVPYFLPEKGESQFFCSAYFETDNADSAIIEIFFTNKITLADSTKITTRNFSAMLPVEKKRSERKYVVSLSPEILTEIKNTPAVFEFPFKSAEETELNFSVRLFEQNIETYNISSVEVNDYGDYIPPVTLKTYAPSPEPKNVLAVQKNGFAEIAFFYDAGIKTKISFWSKALSDSSFRFSLCGKNGSDTLCVLESNRFQTINFRDTLNVESENDFFAFRNVWNNFSLQISTDEIIFSVNENVISRKSIFPGASDTLKIAVKNNSAQNIYFKNFLAEAENEEQQTVIKNVDFSNCRTTDSLESLIAFENCTLEKIEFPVIIHPPQINITISSAYTTIDWYNDKDENVARFVLEKSPGFKNFVPIYTVENAEPNRRYYYDDYNSNNNTVIFYRIKQTDLNGDVVYSRQVKVGKAKINDFTVEQNYPNPFNPETSFSLNVIIPGYFRIAVYDLVGKEIQILHDGTLTQGTYKFNFEANNLPSGIYLLRVQSPNQTVVRKMIFAK